jgi:TolB protein
LLDGFVLAFFWSPDGGTIAALRVIGPGGDGVAEAAASLGITLQLVFVDVVTGTTRSERSVELVELYARQFLPYFDQYALSHRIWAPDSAAIALPLIGDDGIARLYVVPADGSDPRAIAEGVFGVWGP